MTIGIGFWVLITKGTYESRHLGQTNKHPWSQDGYNVVGTSDDHCKMIMMLCKGSFIEILNSGIVNVYQCPGIMSLKTTEEGIQCGCIGLGSYCTRLEVVGLFAQSIFFLLECVQFSDAM